MISHLSEPTKHVADAGAALVAIGTLAQILPSVAAFLTIIWMLIRIWESDTVRSLTGRVLKGPYNED